MSDLIVIHSIRTEYEAGLSYGNDPVAKTHYERAIEFAEKHEVYPHAYYWAHERLSELFEFVMEKPKADYYRKRLKEVIRQDK